VFPDANLDQVVLALQFALGLNRGRTCIAPRRVFAQGDAAQELRARLEELPRPERRVDLPARTRAELEQCLDQGARILAGDWDSATGSISYPLILEGVADSSSFWREDHFAPIALFAAVEDAEEALERDQACPVALGSSLYSRDVRAAQAWAMRLPAQVITINDTIVPTADPRLPFGGSRNSGFGVTRGEEGLLEMTTPKVVIRRGASSRTRHLNPPSPVDEASMRALLQATHGPTFIARIRALQELVGLEADRKRQVRDE
jgi:aldehyde dehydrogenase (NAD+)